MRIRYGRFRFRADICVRPDGSVSWNRRRFAVLEPGIAVHGETRRVVCVNRASLDNETLVIRNDRRYLRRPFVRAISRSRNSLVLTVDPL